MRFPAVAGRFYPADADALSSSIEECFRHPLGPGMPSRRGGDRSIRGIMVPHAGYMCSGMTAAHAFGAVMEDGAPETYIVIGPDHHGTAYGRNVLSSEDFLTPLGVCRADKGICEALSDSVPDIPEAHLYEHSIEVELPFIQWIDPSSRIVPIIMGDQSLESARRLADALKEACDGRDAVVVASSDMSHYVPKDVASRLDGMVLEKVSAMDAEGMHRTVLRNRVSMCGYGPVAAAMMFCDGAHAEDVLHTDSFDSLGLDPGSVVGYASAVFRA